MRVTQLFALTLATTLIACGGEAPAPEATDAAAPAGGKNITVRKDGTDMFIGDAKVIASVRASNGWVHVVDGVILP